MGKRIIQQRRGKGSHTYKSPTHRFKAFIGYPSYSEKPIQGKIEKLLHSVGYSAPLVKVRLNNGKIFYNLASEKLVEKQNIFLGGHEIKEGNILSLVNIPEGTAVYNIELRPGDGGKLVRGAGSSARILKQIDSKVLVLMPSKEEKLFNAKARATIGVIAAGGRKEKPLVKAGKKWYLMKAKSKLYPRTSAVKMNALDHPFGGGRGKVIGKPKTPPRFAPAGRKVGLLRAKRTGRRKKK
ncbi:50S ribosomal protein L2 [Candidatus Pacearchaeota archaeon ex4484_26]|nr:MAG: 50S ribosomal protein L2 [Candidatus Pacearchaeota archaeon ex4484_26]